MRFFRLIMRILFIIAAVACPVINLKCGGRAWSVVVLWSVYTALPIVIFPLVGNNLISQGVRLTLNVAVLLTLIDIFLASGWARVVVPIVMSASLAVLACLYFTDLRRHRQNVMPFFLALVTAVFLAAVFLISSDEVQPAMIVMGLIAAALLAAVTATMRGELWREVKKYFHTV